MAFKDTLSYLDYRTACKLLGAQGATLIRRGGKWEIDLMGQTSLDNKRFVLNLGEATVTIADDPGSPKRLRHTCTSCTKVCEHIGAAYSLILEEKTLLGLAAPPPEDVPLESLDEEQLLERALQERTRRAAEEKMILKPADRGRLWTDYTVTSRVSGKTYRVALRGWEQGQSYGSCPDFKVNTLGTCKHIIYALNAVGKRFSREEREKPYRRKAISLHLRYDEDVQLRLLLPEKLDPQLTEIAEPLRERSVTDIQDLLRRIKQIEELGFPVTIYPDAEEYINNLLVRQRLQKKMEELRRKPERHFMRKNLLKIELLPYQLDGVAFAVGAGRAVLADDMGLGKTIQGIGVAKLLRQEVGISRVLVVCPASVKAQWRDEIDRATDLDWQIVLGSAEERAQQYDEAVFFTICNYEQVLRDIKSIESARWDLIILDEGQRIKNWEAKTSRTIKSLRSPYALVLSGTPLENRLNELYSVVQFIDSRRLGPAFRFFHRHRVVSDKGKLLGYKNLGDLRERLRGVLLRRTRPMVMKELPPRSTEILRIPPTEEQADIHAGNKKIISTILSKKYITEMDMLRLQKALLLCRMAADSTYLVDKTPPGYSSKLEELSVLLERLLAEEERKIVLFSEWTTMLNLIERVLENMDAEYVRLDGSVPQKKRPALMHTFQTDPACKLFLTTNAGATGLNLQAANTVINVDLPWNPAILEQRISRAHRMGQRRPVQVYILITEETIEESLLDTLAAKKQLAMAALDASSEVEELSFTGSVEELKRRLEVLLGEKPEAPVDESRKLEAEREALVRSRRQAVATAGGQLFSAAFAFVGELLGQEAGKEAAPDKEEETYLQILSDCLERDEDGGLKMTIRFQDDSKLKSLARTLRAITRTAGQS